MAEVVLDANRLLRRVRFLHPDHVKPDGSASSLAFKIRRSLGETGLSVDIERLTTLQRSIMDHSLYRLYFVLASYVREIGLDCVHDPQEENYAHALIIGAINNKASERLARHARRIAYPS